MESGTTLRAAPHYSCNVKKKVLCEHKWAGGNNNYYPAKASKNTLNELFFPLNILKNRLTSRVCTVKSLNANELFELFVFFVWFFPCTENLQSLIYQKKKHFFFFSIIYILRRSFYAYFVWNGLGIKALCRQTQTFDNVKLIMVQKKRITICIRYKSSSLD